MSDTHDLPAVDDIADVVELRARLEELTARIAALEARLDQAAAAEPPPEEIVLAISAACAAYLGKRATVKHVRLRRSGNWAAAGRSGIHQSHAVPRGGRPPQPSTQRGTT